MGDVDAVVMQRRDLVVGAARDRLEDLDLEPFASKKPSRSATATGSEKMLRAAE
jgi:hypothetical protein